MDCERVGRPGRVRSKKRKLHVRRTACSAERRLAPLRRRPPPEGRWEQPDYAVYEPERPAAAVDPPAAAASRRLLRTDLYMPTDYMLRQLLGGVSGST